MLFWAAQILGVIICGISCASYIMKRKENFLVDQFLVNFLYMIQYWLLGAFSGTVSNLVSLIKYVVFYNNAKKGKKNPVWQVIFFCLLSLVFGLFTLDGWYSLVPMITAVVFTYAIWQDNPIVLRVIALICQLMWIGFNFAVSAYVSGVYSIVECMVTMYSIVKLIKEQKINVKAEENA